MGWRKPKPFQCSICGKDFNKLSQIKKHCKGKHDSDFLENYEKQNSNQRISTKPI